MNNEPVAWMTQVVGGNKYKWDLVFSKPIPHDLYESIPLYTRPSKQLSDERVKELAKKAGFYFHDAGHFPIEHTTASEFSEMCFQRLAAAIIKEMNK